MLREATECVFAALNVQKKKKIILLASYNQKSGYFAGKPGSR